MSRWSRNGAKLKSGMPEKRALLPKPTAALVIAERGRNPCATMRAIGEHAGVTSERVRQLLKRAGLPTAALRLKTKYACPSCGKVFQKKPKSYDTCKSCRKLTLICEMCGKKFLRYQHLVIIAIAKGSQPRWCSKSCQGKWLSQWRERR